MENDTDFVQHSKNVCERQALTLNLNENMQKLRDHPTEYTDDVDNHPNFLYKNSIKFSAALPQVNI